MMDKKKWRGKELINKIQLMTFLVLYMLLIPLLNYVKADESGYISLERILTFWIIALVIAVAVLLEVNWSLSYLKKKIEEVAGGYYGKGRADHGGGRTENYKWPIAEMYAFEEASKDLKEKTLQKEAQNEAQKDNIMSIQKPMTGEIADKT